MKASCSSLIWLYADLLSQHVGSACEISSFLRLFGPLNFNPDVNEFTQIDPKHVPTSSKYNNDGAHSPISSPITCTFEGGWLLYARAHTISMLKEPSDYLIERSFLTSISGRGRA